MTIAQLIDRGAMGHVDYALVIEGWPDIWVTNRRLTLTATADDRNVRYGLLHDGIEIQETARPGEGRIEGQGIAFRIASTNESDEATESFCNYTEPVAQLETSLTTSTTTLDVVGTTTLSDGYYYIGSETIEVSTWPAIVRARHGSYAQEHNVSNVESDNVSIWIYDKPPALDGRRATLYMKTRGDSETQLFSSEIIWRGYIQNPARLASDGVTWEVTAGHISALLAQTVAPTEVDLEPVGLYHSRLCAVQVSIKYNSNAAVSSFVSGFHLTPQDLVTDVQTAIDDLLTDLSATAHTVTFEFHEESGYYRIQLRTDSTAPDQLAVYIGSPLIGYLPNLNAIWVDVDTGEGKPSGVLLDGSTTYELWLTSMEPEFLGVHRVDDSSPPPTFPSRPLTVGTQLGGSPFARRLGAPIFGELINYDLSSAFSEFRLYVNRDMSGLTNDALAIEFADVTALFEVTNAGNDTDGDFIDVGARISDSGTFASYVTPDTGLRPLMSYGTGNPSDFIDQLIARGDEANDGIVPHVVSDDFGTSVMTDADLPERVYLFSSDEALEEVLAAEALWHSLMWSTNSTGQLRLIPLPLISAGASPAYTLDTSGIVTPADGYGAWPRTDIQQDGLFNTVVLQEGYDPVAEDWGGRVYVIKGRSSVAEHKNRGKGNLEVKPYSATLLGESIDEGHALIIGGKLLSFLSRPYMTITVQVGWSMLNARIGDVVALTCPQVPNGQGGRGFTGKRCFVVSRRWQMDPAAGGAPGELVLWAMLRDVAGYAPSAWLTGTLVDNGGDEWTLNAGSVDARNIALSQLGDGKVLSHFVAGDKVRIYEVNAASGDTQTGEVVSVDADSEVITVQFDGTFNNSASQYVLEFQDWAVATDNQKQYAHAADSDRLMSDGTVGRQFV